ncbi:DUF2547 family protein [Zophobihabitans entericus]|uniref:DUF2547 family protein n=1 Tax=Zophobihabitans entericus TaxID=1635327 RepID=A0A6G9I824_9GAMM|nr:DUF2547 family protein [Zophobihabitans entericus]QIQ20361.1 DUF2547 family protein [Zophobihabitans entericus]
MIINYWQQISKRYFLSHLLLGVIAAGFGLSMNPSALPNQITGQPVNIITIASIAKAHLQESLSTQSTQAEPFYLTQPKLISSQTLLSQSYVSQFSIVVLAICFWFSIAHGIRAGPSSL